MFGTRSDHSNLHLSSASSYNITAFCHDNRKCFSGFVAKLLEFCLLKLVEVIVLLYDIVTFLPSYCYQRPYRVLQSSMRLKAKPLIGKDTRSPFRSVDSFFQLTTTPLDGINTIWELFDYAVLKHADLPALGTREQLSETEEVVEKGRIIKKAIYGKYIWATYKEVEERVLNLRSGLWKINNSNNASGNLPSKIVIFAETRADWIIVLFACMKAKFPVVTLYSSRGDVGIVHGINEVEASTIILSPDLLPKTREMLSSLKSVSNVVVMGPCKTETVRVGSHRFVHFYSMAELETMGKHNRHVKIEVEPPKPDDLAFIMYTSGSLGVPKGVMLSHRNVICALSGQGQRVGHIGPEDIYVGYLPLTHVMEATAEICCFFRGVRIGFSSKNTLTENCSGIKKGSTGDLAELQPTLMAAIPLIMDKIYKAVWEKVQKGPSYQSQLFTLAYAYKQKNFEAGLVFSRIRDTLGGKIRMMLTGEAPLSPQSQRFMNICFCCPILQGYGLTETSGAAAVSEIADRSTGRVGAPLQCNDIMLVNWEEGNYYATDRPFPRGEIWIGGDNVALGYYGMPEATNESFKTLYGKRWFASGDIGIIEPDGCLRIIDRKKDLIKLQGGEYVALAKIETQLKMCSILDNICVYADSSRSYTVCLVVPNMKNLEQLASDLGLSVGWPYICNDPEVVSAVLKEVQLQGIKSKLESFEIPQRLTIVPDIWTPEVGMVTQALKLKRKSIESYYLADIIRMYS